MGNLMNKYLNAFFIECVENDLTLREICNTLRIVWGDAKRGQRDFRQF